MSRTTQVGLENKQEAKINPATEEKQDDIISAIGGGNQAVQVATDSGDDNIKYVGKAVIGSSTASAVWQIKQIDATSGVVITWADGDDNADNIWDNREALSYS